MDTLESHPGHPHLLQGTVTTARQEKQDLPFPDTLSQIAKSFPLKSGSLEILPTPLNQHSAAARGAGSHVFYFFGMSRGVSMNCVIPEAEDSRGKTHQKVSGQITAKLKVLVGPGLWQRRKKKEERQKRNRQGVTTNFKNSNLCLGELCGQRRAVSEPFLCPQGHHQLGTQTGIRK